MGVRSWPGPVQFISASLQVVSIPVSLFVVIVRITPDSISESRTDFLAASAIVFESSMIFIFFVGWWRGDRTRAGWGLGGQVAVTSVSNPMLKRGGLAFNAGKNFATCAGV